MLDGVQVSLPYRRAHLIDSVKEYLRALNPAVPR
jgi:hypothetical protein